MYKSFEEAKAAAVKVINNLYNGEKMGCCVTENKLKKNSRKTSWGFQFNSEDSKGKFIMNGDGSYSRLYAL